MNCEVVIHAAPKTCWNLTRDGDAAYKFHYKLLNLLKWSTSKTSTVGVGVYLTKVT